MMCVFETFINHFATLFPRSPSLGFTHISFSAHDYFLLSRVAEIQQFEKALLKLGRHVPTGKDEQQIICIHAYDDSHFLSVWFRIHVYIKGTRN